MSSPSSLFPPGSPLHSASTRPLRQTTTDIVITDILEPPEAQPVGSLIGVTVIAENRGETGSQTFDVLVNGEVQETVTFSLSSGETGSDVLGLESPGVGTMSITVGSPTRTVEIIEPEQNGGLPGLDDLPVSPELLAIGAAAVLVIFLLVSG